MKQEIEVHVFMSYGYKKDYSGKHWTPDLWMCKVSEEEDRVYVGAQTLTIEVPDDFNPIPAQVAALEKEKAAALAAYQRSVADINERLSKLLAITNEAEA